MATDVDPVAGATPPDPSARDPSVPEPEPTPAPAQRRWTWIVAAAVAGAVVALGVVVVVGRPFADRPSLARLRELQAGLDASIEQRHLDGVTTHLDLVRARVVVELTGRSCEPPVGFRTDLQVTADEWAHIEVVPDLPHCEIDI